MRKTLLLVFIHGFKGGDDTFSGFPRHLKAVLSRKLPAIDVRTLVYPKYETRGSLQETVHIFREWLQNQVIDLEVSNRTASPTVDPSVHVFLIGHSMGGIVAADTLLLLASEQPIPMKPSPPNSLDHPDEGMGKGAADSESPDIGGPSSFMFPHIQGVFAFDTPYFGIAPGVVSYGAEGHYKSITTTYNAFSEVAGLFGLGAGSTSSSKEAPPPPKDDKKLLPAASDGDAAATPSWQRWGRYAMFAGAAGAVAAGGAAAMYSQRHRLTDSWGWVSSHLAFVGCLARPAELRQRLSQLAQVRKDRGIKCVNFFTCLGNGASSLVENKSTVDETGSSNTSFSSKIIRSKDRTFCCLPEKQEGQGKPTHSEPGLEWIKAVNDRATDEIQAHTCMFLPKQNPAFNELINNACTAMVRSVDRGWYSTAQPQSVDDDTDEPRPEKGRAHNQAESGPLDDGDEDVVIVG
ncbi:hypothetical protein BJX63DRAFT_77238 [Aspergillus granulosus]|uniref:DUF676 domain-containing protein n=1 Tax=Aspergillus granulosus TaxID=176169 RepID=A0ABR4GW35_9EURO